MLNSKALTKIQTTILATIVMVAGVIGVFSYVLLGGQIQSAETIKIGLCVDIDNSYGERIWQGATLAAEQVNAEGGVLGRNFEIVVEDSDVETSPYDIVVATSAMTRLITVDKVNFALGGGGAIFSFPFQDICADHNIIFFSPDMEDNFTQRVGDNYERYKGCFRVGAGNLTSAHKGMTDSILTLREYTGFSKVAYLAMDVQTLTDMASGMADFLRGEGFDVVYEGTFPVSTFDFSSYFAAVEASGAEILVPFVGGSLAVPLVKEYHDRQSHFVTWGVISHLMEPETWENTDGKCEFVSAESSPVVSGYPLTSKTIPTRNAFMERWGRLPGTTATSAYDLVRFILPDAIRRAGTIEYDAMIRALEETDVETSNAQHWVFTANHDVMVGEGGPNNPGEDYILICMFQWQNGVQVPVYPKGIMEETGATYKFPDWSGPWDEIS